MITQSDLNQVEKFADRLFAKVGIDKVLNYFELDVDVKVTTKVSFKV